MVLLVLLLYHKFYIVLINFWFETFRSSLNEESKLFNIYNAVHYIMLSLCRKGPQENASTQPGVYYLDQQQWNIGNSSLLQIFAKHLDRKISK